MKSLKSRPPCSKHLCRTLGAMVATLWLTVADSSMMLMAEDNLEAPRRITNKFGMEFVEIPTGKYIMGSALGGPKEKPHEVEITKPFFLGATEVTSRHEILIRIAAGEYNREEYGTPSVDRQSASTIVSWNEAQELAETLSKLDPDYNYRLPTEAEWEYACRGVADAAEPAADDAPVSQPYRVEYGAIEPVKLTRPNAFGVYDMLRNAGEYCSDWYAADYYQNSPLKDPTGPAEGKSKVARGVRSEGHDRSYSCWRRYPVPPEGDSNILIGVRFVLEQKKKD